ncbi:multiheme c-type cytochrome [Ancylomarina sp.]|uniref:multiheme c-type cytochrome n=1 Tax=Ancylomarina sp. TaxID=1970196 RepID=UPI0035695997
MKSRNYLSYMVACLFVFGLGFSSCSNDDDDIDVNPIPDPSEMSYVGSESCKTCHSDHFEDWKDSGHPYKFSLTPGSLGPVYPDVADNFESAWLTNLTDGNVTWDNIAGVVGGYGWKVRFVGVDGEIIGTKDSQFNPGMGHNQFNFNGGEDHGWSNYHPGDKKTYNYSCFKCHTTGGTQEGTWLAGVEGLGTFTESGIGCESCHGPGSVHIEGPTKLNIDKVYEMAHLDNSMGGLEVDGIIQKPDAAGNDVNFLCGTCHNRDYKSPINASGGFIKHHEQWDELTTTKHIDGGMSCTTCHDPHKRVIWDGDGIKKTCTSCHSTQTETTNHSALANCIDCHMPLAAKSGAKTGDSGYEGDVRSHLMKITVKDESMFTEDGKWVRDDETRPASLALEYACLGCHNRKLPDNIPNITLEKALSAAKDMHK